MVDKTCRSKTTRRIEALRKRLRELNIDAALITKRENYIYLSGFTGTLAVLIIGEDKSLLVTDFRYLKQAEIQAPAYKIVEYKGNLLDALAKQIQELKIERLGFEESVPFRTYKEYESKFLVKELVPLGDLVESLRMVKDEYEIEAIKKAAKIADDAFKFILGYIKPGISEADVAAELEYFMKKKGASGASFDIIVASGIRAAMPHGVASEKKIEKGDAVVLDFGAVYNNYCSDITRTVFVGYPCEELKKVYGTVLHAQKSALECAVSGKTGKEVDWVARKIIGDSGYEKNFGHGLGHGVGLEIHEEPRLSPMGDKQLKEGMVVTVEPGIYIEGIGGVRIEDLIVINNEKPSILTESPKEMIIL